MRTGFQDPIDSASLFVALRPKLRRSLAGYLQLTKTRSAIVIMKMRFME